MSDKRKIAIVTGSRGEYGYIRPIIKKIVQEPTLDYELIVTNMHLLSEYGHTIEEIEKDGFKIGATHHMTFDGYTNTTMAKSLGVFLLEIPDTLERLKPDIILIAGDRGEQLMAAIAGAHMNIPVAHVQAGENSGNIDGIMRHAIAKIAHIHFAANEDAAQRVKKMGEDDFRIFVTGAPMLDEMMEERFTKPDDLARKYGLDLTKPIILAVQHPVTEEFHKASEQISQTFLALREINEQTIVIHPNADAGSRNIKEAIRNFSTSKMKVFRSLPREDYLGFMKIASVMVGNSSSGIIEAPVFGLPVVNIGRRQTGRLQGNNVINIERFDKDEIVKAIRDAVSPQFKSQIIKASPYGDGKSAERIVQILKDIKIDDRLVNKRITY